MLPRIISGQIVATTALAEGEISYSPGQIKLRAVPYDDRYILNGTKYFVPDAHLADLLICLARTGPSETELTAFLVDTKNAGLECSLLKTLSGTKYCKVALNNVKVPDSNILGEVGKSWPNFEKMLQMATIATCAESVGCAQRALDLTVEYAKARKQFGQHIGSFQVIQHYCVDMLSDVETMRLAVYQAACMLKDNVDCQKEVAATKAWVSERFRHAALLGLKIHGGTGYMEDHDISVLYRKALEAYSAYGNPDFHKETVAKALGI